MYKFRVVVVPILLDDHMSIVLIFNLASITDSNPSSESAPYALHFDSLFHRPGASVICTL